MAKRLVPIIVANWKMNGTLLESMQFFKKLRFQIQEGLVACNIVICPPFTLLRDFAEKVPGTGVHLGGQNCHHEASGAYTGEISARQLKDMTCDYVILGHSERRLSGADGSELVQKKVKAAHHEKLSAIVCIGETQYERDNGLTKIVLREQLLHSIPPTATHSNTIIAYEPVWAIGSGLTPSAEDIQTMHGYILDTIQSEFSTFDTQTRVIYGGSVTSQNANMLLSIPHVSGLLVGKASLDADHFWNIISAIP